MHHLNLNHDLLARRLDSKTRLHHLNIPIIGLTGSIATGKSTISRYFKQMNLNVAEADALVKEIYNTDESKSFVSQLNTAYLNQNNEINFKLLRQDFFQDQNLKSKLEAYIYPRLIKKITQICQGIDYLIYDVPLLFERYQASLFDHILIVYCTPEQQLKRLLQRDQINETLAKQMIALQTSIEIKKELGDTIFDNTKNENDLILQADEWLKMFFIH